MGVADAAAGVGSTEVCVKFTVTIAGGETIGGLTIGSLITGGLVIGGGKILGLIIGAGKIGGLMIGGLIIGGITVFVKLEAAVGVITTFGFAAIVGSTTIFFWTTVCAFLFVTTFGVIAAGFVIVFALTGFVGLTGLAGLSFFALAANALNSARFPFSTVTFMPCVFKIGNGPKLGIIDPWILRIILW